MFERDFSSEVQDGGDIEDAETVSNEFRRISVQFDYPIYAIERIGLSAGYKRGTRGKA